MLSFQNHYGLINVCACVSDICTCDKFADLEDIAGKTVKYTFPKYILHQQHWNRKTCTYLFQEN